MARSSSYIATPPGATIKEQLVDRGMSQKEFSVRMDMSEKHISRLINGEVQLTPDVANRLEVVLGVPAKFWNNLEAIYREKLLKVQAENSMEKDEELARQLPYNEMSKYGWVPQTKNSKEKVTYLRKYFEVVDLSLIENTQITRIACRRLAITEKSDLALIAWAQEARLMARDITTAPINLNGLIKAIPQIRKMTMLKPDEFGSSLKKILSDNGIALVFLPHLKGSFLQGASFVDGNKIVVGLTVRGKDADKFWFSLFHELGHIILGHISYDKGITVEDENAADEWSRDTLISKEDFLCFTDKCNFTKLSILEFSKNQGVAPGIVVGRLQNEKYISYNMFNDLKEQYELAL